MKLTIKDIARKSGFSCSTVSRVLTNNPNVDSETRDKIKSVIEELGYKPSSIARGLVKGNINIVCLIVGDITNAFYAELTRAAEEVLNKAGYLVVLCDSNYDPTKEEKYIETAMEVGFSGVIMVTAMETKTLIDYLGKIQCPVVLVSRYLPSVNTDVVMADNYRGAYLATNYLIELGHKRIAHLTGAKDSTASQDRLRGFLDAMKDASLEVKSSNLYQGDLRYSTGYEYGQYLLKNKTDITAVFCGNDLMASGIVDAYFEQGKSIPGDLSLIGYDDSPVAVQGKVKLTTVKVHSREMGKAAAETILNRIASKEKICRQIVFPPELIIRESTKKL